ncbi:MAG: hypothetical protein ACTSRG_03070 [Candidatus Helarchaeota archaeon]
MIKKVINNFIYCYLESLGYKFVPIGSIYMIRGGGFGEDFGIKLIMAIITILICIYDWKKNKRYDYFWVFIDGTLIWSTVELVLQLSGTRVIPNKILFGIQIPLWISVPLQGISEGAAIAVYGIFAGDNFADEKNRKLAITIFAIIMSGLFIFSMNTEIKFPNIGLFVPSRRLMFTGTSIVFLGLMVAIVIYFLIKAEPEWSLYLLGLF